MITVIPPERPPIKLSGNLNKVATELIAASQVFPTNLPTIIESTVVYICWMMLPAMIGNTNMVSTNHTFPSVRSFFIVVFFHFFFRTFCISTTIINKKVYPARNRPFVSKISIVIRITIPICTRFLWPAGSISITNQACLLTYRFAIFFSFPKTNLIFSGSTKKSPCLQRRHRAGLTPGFQTLLSESTWWLHRYFYCL